MQKTTIKHCKKHGTTEFVLEGRGYHRCKKCRTAAVTKNRQNRKDKLVKFFGGKCKLCGYDKCQQAMDFHHVDPKQKEFGIASFGVCRSWTRMLTEAKKCILVCCRCHAEVEAGITKIPEHILQEFKTIL